MSFKISDLQIPPPKNGERFEELCLDLYKAEFGPAQQYGSPGQAQQGVDIFILNKDIGIQCKKRDYQNGKITEKELSEYVKEAKKYKPPLKRFILATTCKRDAKIQKSAELISKEHEKEKLFSIKIDSWDEIIQFLEEHPKILEKYYPFLKTSNQHITPDLIKSIQSESSHKEINRIRDLINDNQPQTALELFDKFEKDKWDQIDNKEKFRLITNKAVANIKLQQYQKGVELFIKALQFNPEDERANANCAQAWLIIGDRKKAKKYIEKTKQLNHLNQIAHFVEIWIKDGENQPIDKIVSDLPEPLKENDQIARALYYMMINRKQYKEAKKQLDIFYQQINEQNQENIEVKLEWADMAMRWILRKDIISPAPDDLKETLIEIIKIYKNFLTNQKYSELQRSDPDLYMNYAKALKLKGDFSEAIKAFQKGIDAFPKDSPLKIELAQLYMMQKDWGKIISLLEELPELQPFIESDSVNKTQLKEKPIYILEKPFIVIMLADSYFNIKKNKKAFQFLDKVIKSSFLNRNEKLIVQQFQIFRQISLGKIDDAERELNLFFEKNQGNTFNLILKSKIEDAKEKSTTYRGEKQKSENHKEKKILYLKQALDVFNKKNKETPTSTDSKIHEYEYIRDLEHLYRELMSAKIYQSAEPLLEQMTNQNLNHPDIFSLLYVYFENGKNKQAIELAKSLLKKFPDNAMPADILFRIYESLGDIKTAIRHYENFIKSNPDNVSIKIELALAYIQNKNLKKAKELLRTPLDTSRLNAEQTSRLSFAYRHVGDTKQALEIQYQRIKQNPNEWESQKAYFMLVTFLDKPKSFDLEKGFDMAEFEKRESKNKLILYPKAVSEDCYVQIQEVKIQDGKEMAFGKQEIIIEKSAPIYTPEHEFSQALDGKTVGDIIPFNNKKYKIIEIKSKYIYKYHKLEMETKFPSQTFMRSTSIPKRDSITEIEKSLKKMLPNRQKQQDQYKALFQLYKERRVPLGSIAKKLSNHPIEIMGQLFHSKENKLISSVPLWEKGRGIQEILDEKPDILIDLLSLIVIHQIQIEEYVEKSQFKLYICQSALDSLKEYIDEKSLHLKDGLLEVGFDESGKLKKSVVPPEQIKQHLILYEKIKTWAEKHCHIKSLSPDIVLSRQKRQQFEQLIGKEFFDPILALYKDKNTVFLSEDAILKFSIRSFHKEIEGAQATPLGSSIPSARAFDLIDWFERQAVIDKNQATQFKSKLVKLNHTYIPIDHNILFFLLKEAEYNVNNLMFQRGLFFLGPVSNWEGAFAVTADFLIELCQTPSLLPYRKQLIIKETLDRVSFGRDKSSKETAYQIIQLIQNKTQLLPLLQDELCHFIVEWLKPKIY